jgi:hypothetical protein
MNTHMSALFLMTVESEVGSESTGFKVSITSVLVESAFDESDSAESDEQRRSENGISTYRQYSTFLQVSSGAIIGSGIST